MPDTISVIIPALNEADSIAAVVRSLPPHIHECIVVDNGSTDATSSNAQAAGARVITAPRGYGSACYAGTQAATGTVLVFLDGDGADNIAQFDDIASPILNRTADFVIGSRLRGRRDPGSMTFPQIFAAHLVGSLVRRMYGFRYTDMSAFRAIRRSTLLSLNMTERTFGWNLEMQIRALQHNLRILELPVDYHCRTAGESKVSGNLRAAAQTAWRIFGVLARTRRSSHT